jgi:SAM-dependent methyltransferase
MSQMSPPPKYLQPYLNAAQRHGAGFSSLLWATPKSQAVRFAALARSCRLQDKVVLDVGCGRADFLDFLLQEGIQPASYIGLEAIAPLADAAEQKHHPCARIIRGDFVRDPGLLDQNADAIIFCGSLNTLDKFQFIQAMEMGWRFTRCQLAFNFLCSPALAAAPHLVWHSKEEVVGSLRGHRTAIVVDDRYLSGDCTVVMTKFE